MEQIQEVECEECEGSSVIECPIEYGGRHQENCPACGGEQKIVCPICGGTGKHNAEFDFM